MGFFGKIFGESRRTQEYNLKRLAIIKDVELTRDLRNTAADNLILAGLGIDHTADENKMKAERSKAWAGATADMVSNVAGVVGSVINPASGLGNTLGDKINDIISGAGNSVRGFFGWGESVESGEQGSMIMIVVGVIVLLLILRK